MSLQVAFLNTIPLFATQVPASLGRLYLGTMPALGTSIPVNRSIVILGAYLVREARLRNIEHSALPQCICTAVPQVMFLRYRGKREIVLRVALLDMSRTEPLTTGWSPPVSLTRPVTHLIFKRTPVVASLLLRIPIPVASLVWARTLLLGAPLGMLGVALLALLLLPLVTTLLHLATQAKQVIQLALRPRVLPLLSRQTAELLIDKTFRVPRLGYSITTLPPRRYIQMGPLRVLVATMALFRTIPTQITATVSSAEQPCK